jgi:hypothetical protein
MLTGYHITEIYEQVKWFKLVTNLSLRAQCISTYVNDNPIVLTSNVVLISAHGENMAYTTSPFRSSWNKFLHVLLAHLSLGAYQQKPV